MIIRAIATAGITLLLASLQSSAIGVSSKIDIQDTGIEITLLEEPTSDLLQIARFNNPVSRVFLLQDEGEIMANLRAHSHFWEIRLPDISMTKGNTLFIETIGRPQLAGKQILIEPNESGTLLLHAHLATSNGEQLRYEPLSKLNSISNWTNPNEFPEWSFKVPQPGKYRVVIHQGCGEGQGGSRAEIVVGDQTLKFKVKETDHFQDFEERKVGTLKIESTEDQTLQVRITKLSKKAAMNIRMIELIPIN